MSLPSINYATRLPPPTDLDAYVAYGYDSILHWQGEEEDVAYLVQGRLPEYPHPLGGLEWLGVGSGYHLGGTDWASWGAAAHMTATHEFRVQGISTSDGTVRGEWAYVTTEDGYAGGPGVPQNVRVTAATGSSITVAWDEVSGATGYDVSRITIADMRKPISIRWWDDYYQPEVVHTSWVTEATFDDLTGDTTYYIVVQSLGEWESDKNRSESALLVARTYATTAPPQAPGNLGARPADNLSGIQLRWEDNSYYESEFVIERTGGGTSYFYPDANVTTYTDTTAVAGQSYTYKVKAVNAAGASSWSNTANTTIVLPTVSITADIADASEFKGDWGQYKITRSLGSLGLRHATEDIAIVRDDSSMAVPADYAMADVPATILAGQTEDYIQVYPVADEVVELDELLVMAVQSGTLYAATAPTTAGVTIHEHDLIDIDSDNNNGFDEPDQTTYEDLIENDPDQPGKIIFVNDDDDDGDFIPDLFDGHDADETPGTMDDGPPTLKEGERFVPVLIRIPTGIDPQAAWFRIEYDAATPGPTPASGSLRLWTRNGYERRDWRSFLDDGDFIPATNGVGEHYTYSELQQLPSPIYVEATAEGTPTITVKVDPDGPGGPQGYTEDTVKLTAVSPRVDIEPVEPDWPTGSDTPAVFRISRPGSTSEDMDVYFALTGSAEPGVDYDGEFETITIPAGFPHIDVVFTPLNAAFNAQGKSILMTLTGVSILGIGKFNLFSTGAILIKQASGTTTQVPATSGNLRSALQAAINQNDLITQLTITGHGDETMIQLNETDLITVGAGGQGGIGVILDNQGDITALMQNALDPAATVNLQGCHTGWGGESIAQRMSGILNGPTVYGAKRYLARVGKNSTVGAYRTFKNGQEQ
jgi:hypothetical protein